MPAPLPPLQLAADGGLTDDAVDQRAHRHRAATDRDGEPGPDRTVGVGDGDVDDLEFGYAKAGPPGAGRHGVVPSGRRRSTAEQRFARFERIRCGRSRASVHFEPYVFRQDQRSSDGSHPGGGHGKAYVGTDDPDAVWPHRSGAGTQRRPSRGPCPQGRHRVAAGGRVQPLQRQPGHLPAHPDRADPLGPGQGGSPLLGHAVARWGAVRRCHPPRSGGHRHHRRHPRTVRVACGRRPGGGPAGGADRGAGGDLRL